MIISDSETAADQDVHRREIAETLARKRRMVIYARISDDREGRQNGVERQEKQCRALGDRNGDEVVKVFVDDDRSAYSGKPRPDYIRMLAYLRAGRAEGVLALAPTRLYRRLEDGLEFFRLINEKRLEVQTVKQGRYDLSTADGRRDALRAAVDAQYESDLIGERVRDAKAENLAKGEYRGGPRPFGYESDGVTPRSLECLSCPGSEGFTIDRECRACGAQAVNAERSEAWYIEAATDGVIAGGNVRGITRDLLNANGVRTVARRHRLPDGTRSEPEDRDWTGEELRKMLLRARNAGLIESKGEVVGRAQWAGVVTEAKWRQCKEILTDPARRTTTTNVRVWLGGGLYKCFCGSTMKGGTTGVGGKEKAARLKLAKSHKPSYKCRSGKAHITRDAIALDSYVTALALQRLMRPDAADLLLPQKDNGESVDLARQANSLRSKLEGIAEDFGEDKITRAQMLKMTADAREKLEQVTAQMEAASQESVLAALPLGTPEITELWTSFDLGRKRSIIDALMTITVHKARRGRPKGFKAGSGAGYFDTSTIEIMWKSPE